MWAWQTRGPCTRTTEKVKLMTTASCPLPTGLKLQAAAPTHTPRAVLRSVCDISSKYFCTSASKTQSGRFYPNTMMSPTSTQRGVKMSWHFPNAAENQHITHVCTWFHIRMHLLLRNCHRHSVSRRVVFSVNNGSVWAAGCPHIPGSRTLNNTASDWLMVSNNWL